MDVNWLEIAVRDIIGVCLIVAVVECAVDGSENSGGLRLVCGAAVAASVMRLTAETIRSFL